MRPTTYITTSWDDGHPLDFRVAELLAKYGLNGTFYVPKCAERETMTTAQVRELGLNFELGAHTLHHVVLTRAVDEQAQREIANSKSWIENSGGRLCLMFAPPRGRYSNRHLKMMRDAGYVGMRSAELASLDRPRPRPGMLVMPTSVQTYPHGLSAHTRNAVKRAAFGNLWRFVVHGHSTDWTELAKSLLDRALHYGGVFHLWGHSWELQQTGHWRHLDEVLRMLGEHRSQAPSLTNGQVCELSMVDVAPAGVRLNGHPCST